MWDASRRPQRVGGRVAVPVRLEDRQTVEQLVRNGPMRMQLTEASLPANNKVHEWAFLIGRIRFATF